MKPEILLSRIRIVLCRPSHPGNIGAAARAMKTMGLSNLSLVNPKRFPDAEADTRATAAVDILNAAKVYSTLGDALAGSIMAIGVSARQRDLGPAAGSPRNMLNELLSAARSGEVALVFGNETVGLTNDELQMCQASVSIPANPEFSSLNLGAAVQVLCYEARMSAFDQDPVPVESRTTPFASPRATHDEIEGFYGHLETVMTATGFYNPEQPGRLLAKLRRLFGRSALERDEVNILRGVLAATQNQTQFGTARKRPTAET